MRLLVGEAHLGELGKNCRVLAGRTLAITVMRAEGSPEGSSFEVNHATMDRRGVERRKCRPQPLEITLPERGARGAREVHRGIREVQLGGPAPGGRGLAIPSGGERGGGPARQKVGLVLGVLAVNNEARVLGEHVIDRRAASGQDLLATTQEACTIPRRQLLDVGIVRGRQGPVPLTEVHAHLGCVGECDRVGVAKPEPGWQDRTPPCSARTNPSDHARATKRRG